MSKKPNKLQQAQRNARLAWLAQEICRGQTDAQIIMNCMANFKCSEKSAREDLKEIYTRFSEIEADNLPEQRTKFMELGFALLQDMRLGMAFGPAANQFKTLAQISGVLTDKPVVDTTAATGPAPAKETVRDRIDKLMKSKKVREEALAAGIDLDQLKRESGG